MTNYKNYKSFNFSERDENYFLGYRTSDLVMYKGDNGSTDRVKPWPCVVEGFRHV